MNNSVEQTIEIDGDLNTSKNTTDKIDINQMNQQKSPLNFEYIYLSPFFKFYDLTPCIFLNSLLTSNLQQIKPTEWIAKRRMF